MDASRFDRLTRALSGVTNRRGALFGLLGGVLTPLAPVLSDGEVDAKNRERKDQSPPAEDRKQERQPKQSGGDGPEAAQCLANGQRCGKDSGKNGGPCKKCCSHYATPKSQGKQRCACKPENAACTVSRQCCGGQCTGGQCGPCPAGQTACGVNGCVDLRTSDRNCGNCGAACAAGQTCQGGSCVCTPASCDGCCAGDQCRPGTSDDNCGTSGAVCQNCTGTGVTCSGGGTPGVCGCTPQSNATTCGGKCGDVVNNCGQTVNCTTLCSGCCDGGICRAGTSDANCGKNGGACTQCTGADTCGGGNPGSPGVCGCTAEPAATTCAGVCGTVQNNCGQDVNCTAVCAGCCDGGVCKPGTTDGSCGAGGATCAPCGGSSSCQGGACCTPAGGTASGAAPCCAGLTRCAGDVCKADCCAGVTCTSPQQCSGGACAAPPTCVGFRGRCSSGFQCCSNSCGIDDCLCSQQGEACYSSSDCCKNPSPTASCVGFVCVP